MDNGIPKESMEKTDTKDEENKKLFLKQKNNRTMYTCFIFNNSVIMKTDCTIKY